MDMLSKPERELLEWLDAQEKPVALEQFERAPSYSLRRRNRLLKDGMIYMPNPGFLDSEPRTYAITDKGREATRIFEKQLPYPVREAAQRSALRVVRQIRRDAAIHTSVTEHGEHDLTVRMEMEQVFAIEMAVVSHEQATMLERTFKANAEAIYQKLLGVMTQEYPD